MFEKPCYLFFFFHLLLASDFVPLAGISLVWSPTPVPTCIQFSRNLVRLELLILQYSRVWSPACFWIENSHMKLATVHILMSRISVWILLSVTCVGGLGRWIFTNKGEGEVHFSMLVQFWWGREGISNVPWAWVWLFSCLVGETFNSRVWVQRMGMLDL